MSDLLRSLPQITKQPPRPRPAPNPLTLAHPAPDDDSDSSASSASTADSISTLRPTSARNATLPPSPWTQYFARELFLDHDSPELAATYHAYLTPPRDAAKGPLFICHHGAGASAMSFARFAAAVRDTLPAAGVLSLSARDHGSVIHRSSTPLPDFSLGALTQDALNALALVVAEMGWAKLPPAVFVGHSLGGAVATTVAAEGKLGAQLVGFAVLDVVEGSAIEALSHMRSYLSSRPQRFASVESAVEWHVRSRTLRDVESARASVPSLLIRDGDGDGNGGAGEGWKWRTDLWATKDWWEEWFRGMSGKFLRGRAAKCLVLAGTDRLDKELMVGQMQGRCELGQ